MNSIICLALSCLLIGLLYVFMRQQFAAQDRKIADLTHLVSSIASELQQQPQLAQQAASAPAIEVKRLPETVPRNLLERVTVSDDSESEDDTDEETDSDDSDVEEMLTPPKIIQAPALETVNIDVNVEEVEDVSPIVLDLSEGTKTINLFEPDLAKTNYDKLTVKELKELVAKESGPGSLKTKKELIDFLEKKK